MFAAQRSTGIVTADSQGGSSFLFCIIMNLGCLPAFRSQLSAISIYRASATSTYNYVCCPIIRVFFMSIVGPLTSLRRVLFFENVAVHMRRRLFPRSQGDHRAHSECLKVPLLPLPGASNICLSLIKSLTTIIVFKARNRYASLCVARVLFVPSGHTAQGCGGVLSLQAPRLSTIGAKGAHCQRSVVPTTLLHVHWLHFMLFRARFSSG